MHTEVKTSLRNDLTFKQVFSEKKFLIDFLNAFFKFVEVNNYVVEVEAIPQSLIKSASLKGKLFFGDVIATLDNETMISLEMYNLFREEEYKKSLGYITRIFSNQLEERENHIEAKKVIGINLMEGNYHYNNFDFINDYGFINKRSYGRIKDEYIEMYLIRLDLVSDIRYTKREERFIKWINLINARDTKEMEAISKGDEVMEETVKYVRRFLNNEDILEKYDKMNTLIDQAEYKGEKLGILKTARNLLKLNVPDKDISTATGLSKEEIEALK